MGGQNLPDSFKSVRFLPGRFSPGEYEDQFVIGPSTGLVFPAFFAFGELYDDGTFDDPVELAPIIDLIYETTRITTEYDGRVLLTRSPASLSAYQFGPVFLDEPIVYEEPEPRGPDLNAVAAAWMIGIGAVYHPLPPGGTRSSTRWTLRSSGAFSSTRTRLT